MIEIHVSLPFELPPGSIIPGVFPTLAMTVQRVAQFAQHQWVEYAMGAPLPDGRELPSNLAGNGDYARSIAVTQTGELAYRVQTDWPGAQNIESGWPAYDMKNMLRTSLKVRLNKRGGRYLVIPFRHGTPGAVGFSSTMPQHVHALARELRASRVTGSRQRVNRIGVFDVGTRRKIKVTRRTYAWGDRLPPGLVSKLNQHHRTDPFAGMVRFDNPKGGHSQYLTFRTMSESSRGWIRKAKPGYWLTLAVADQIRPVAESAFKEALEQDLQNYLDSGRLGG